MSGFFFFDECSHVYGDLAQEARDSLGGCGGGELGRMPDPFLSIFPHAPAL